MLFFIQIVNAVTSVSIISNSLSIKINEPIKVEISDASGDSVDWVGIYPKGASNAWENVVSWKYTNGITSGSLTLESIDTVGTYEVRLFFRDSFTLEAKREFSVIDDTPVGDTIVTIPYNNVHYVNGTNVVVAMAVDFKNMGNHSNDWMGLYPVGASNDFKNVLGWTWVRNRVNSRAWVPFTYVRKPGKYEVRAFFNNSFVLEGKSLPLTFVNRKKAYFHLKPNYTLNQKIEVNFHSVPVDSEHLNWIGIYPKGASNAWENVLEWKAIKRGMFAGTISLNPLPLGEYEARLFYNNSYKVEQVKSFNVIEDRVDVVDYVKDVCINGAEQTNSNISVVCNSLFQKLEANVLLKNENKLLLIKGNSIASETTLSDVPNSAILYGDNNRGPITVYDRSTHTSVYYDGSHYDFYLFAEASIKKVLSFTVKENTEVTNIFISQVANGRWQIYLEYTDTEGISYRDIYISPYFNLQYSFLSHIQL